MDAIVLETMHVVRRTQNHATAYYVVNLMHLRARVHA